jgi:hypothetical protein
MSFFGDQKRQKKRQKNRKELQSVTHELTEGNCAKAPGVERSFNPEEL